MIKNMNKVWQLLLSKICYIGDKPYCIDIENKQLIEADKPFGIFVILGRQHYSETTKVYPIVIKRDLKKIIDLEIMNNSHVTFYKISDVFENKRKVVFYQLNKKVIVGNPLLIIPETILIGCKCKLNEGLSYFLPNSEQQVFIANNNGTVVSAMAGGNIVNFERFCLSHGVRVNNELELTNDTFVTSIVSGIKHLQPNALMDFRYQTKTTSILNKVSLEKWGGILAIAFTVYLTVATNVTSYLVDDKRQELVEIRKQSNVVLKQRNDINKILADYQVLKNALSVSDDGIGLWTVLSPLYEHGAKFKVIEITEEQYRIQFESSSAVNNLQLLLNNKNVKDAEFSSSVRKSATGETATITFMIHSLREVK